MNKPEFQKTMLITVEDENKNIIFISTIPLEKNISQNRRSKKAKKLFLESLKVKIKTK